MLQPHQGCTPINSLSTIPAPFLGVMPFLNFLSPGQLLHPSPTHKNAHYIGGLLLQLSVCVS